jgi:hypothetical protein
VVDDPADALVLLVNGLTVDVFVATVDVFVTTGAVAVTVEPALAVAVAGALPGIVNLVPEKIVLPPLYLGFVVSTGLAFLIAATVVPFALAIELSV